MKLVPMTVRDVSYVLANLRPADEAELACQLPPDLALSRAALAYQYAMTGPPNLYGAVVVDRTRQPVMVAGASRLTAGCYSVFAFGTEGANAVALAKATRYLKTLAGQLEAQGARSLEARSLSTNTAAHLWITRTGGKLAEANYPYGGKGELFHTFRWTRNHPVHDWAGCSL